MTKAIKFTNPAVYEGKSYGPGDVCMVEDNYADYTVGMGNAEWVEKEDVTKKAEEAKKAEDAKKAEEAKKAKEAEDAKKVEDAKKLEEAKKAEATKKQADEAAAKKPNK